MNDQLRIPGYYWVKFQGSWIIAEYSQKYFNGHDLTWAWMVMGQYRVLQDSDFTDISEKTIKP